MDRTFAEQVLACPDCKRLLRWEPDSARCPACAHDFPIAHDVVHFLPEQDRFYEGRYARQVHHLPGASALRDWVFFHLVQSGVLGEIERVLPARGRALDLGCAGGIRWLGAAAHTIGLDLSQASLELAAGCYAAAIRASALALPIADASLDLVYSSYLVEHIAPDDKATLFGEIHRTLRPGGHCVLQFDTASNNRLSRFAAHDAAAFRRGFVDHDGHIGLEPLPALLGKLEERALLPRKVVPFGTTSLQYLATYQWLDVAHGAAHGWVRRLGRCARRLGQSKLALPFELFVTTFDRSIQRWADPARATRAIVVARRAD